MSHLSGNGYGVDELVYQENASNDEEQVLSSPADFSNIHFKKIKMPVTKFFFPSLN